MFEITQDHQGYMWLATNLGLVRYDGIDGKIYNINREEASSASNNYVGSLYVDSFGVLWIGTNSGLSKYDPSCDCIKNYPSKIGNAQMVLIRSITEDKSNNIWIGTRDGHLFQYLREEDSISRPLQESFEPLSILDDRIGNLLADKNNNLWIGTNSGLVLFDIASKSVTQFLHDPSDQNTLLDNSIRAIYEDKDGQILVGTFKAGLHMFDPGNGSFRRSRFNKSKPFDLHAPYTEETVFGESPHVNLIHQDQNNDYWLGTTGAGVNQLNPVNKTYKKHEFYLVNPQILWALYEDRQGNIWLGGGMGGGLFKKDIYSGSYQLNTSITNVETAYESPVNPGVLWIMSQENGLGRIDLKTNKITNYMPDPGDEHSIAHKWVRSVYQQDNNTIWVGLGNGGAYGNQDGNGGIDRMDLDTEKFTHYSLIRDDDGREDFSYTVYNISEDKEGYLWLGTGPGGIFRSDKKKSEFRHFKIQDNDTNSRGMFLNIVRIDSIGNVWASDFAGEGTLYLYDREKDMFEPYITGFKMSNILIDDKGWLLISTWEKGLIHFNPVDRSYIQYSKKDGLPSHEALDIVKGENGIVWLGTRMGPAKFDTKTGEIFPLGLPKRRYNYRILKASNNQLYVGSNNGLYSFPADRIFSNPNPPQVDISELLISDKNYLPGGDQAGELAFSYNQNDIAFKFIGLHFSDTNKNLYKYRLIPINMEWTSAGSERIARFFNLPPDTYTFEVIASNSNGVWSEVTSTVSFTIKPAWWTTWWAYTAYIIIAGFLVYRIYHFQLSRRIADTENKKLKEINRFKNTLFTNITHEFRTPLTIIKGMTDSIKNELQNKNINDLGNSLDMIDRNSDGLLKLVNEMLDLAKIESGKMELQLLQSDVIPFLKYLGESFSSLAEENKIHLTIYSEKETLVMDFDAGKLTSVFSNLLSNAIKFTPEYGKIIVHINEVQQKGKSCLFIKIKDNGIGISEEELSSIFDRFYQKDVSEIRKHNGTGIGLALTREFVELMNGSIEVNSEFGKGSEFIVTIPVTRKAAQMENIEIPESRLYHVSDTPLVLSQDTHHQDPELPILLIIEDNLDVAHYLESCLKASYTIIHAINGIIGIEMALERIPDIIISDVMMPGKNGFEVCATLKSDERTDHIPIILLTAKVTIEDRLTGLSHGADAYLAKPFNKKELFTRLDQLISLRKKLISKIQKEGPTGLLKKQTKDPKLLFLKKIVELIHDHMDDSEFGSGELARSLLISESQVYRKIKAITGKSTAVYIRSVRLKYARELLKSTDKTVSEVAYEVGFSDPSWFSRVFKKEFGVPPSAVS